MHRNEDLLCLAVNFYLLNNYERHTFVNLIHCFHTEVDGEEVDLLMYRLPK